MAPSTCSQRSSRLASAASASRSSIAPVLTVPAVAITQAGSKPSARSAAMAASSAARSIEVTGRMRCDAAPDCRGRGPPLPYGDRNGSDPSRRRRAALKSPRRRVRGRRRQPWRTSATARAMMLPIEPPLTSVPLADLGKPTISLSQSTTCRSRRAAACAPPPRLDP